MWDVIVSVPDHCLYFYFVLYDRNILNMSLDLFGQVLSFLAMLVLLYLYLNSLSHYSVLLTFSKVSTTCIRCLQ